MTNSRLIQLVFWDTEQKLWRGHTLLWVPFNWDMKEMRGKFEGGSFMDFVSFLLKEGATRGEVEEVQF